MKVYWDTSALIWFYSESRLSEVSGVTRPHTLAEMFSTLTGAGVQMISPDGTLRLKKLSPGSGVAIVQRLVPVLEYVDLSAAEVAAALANAQAQAVQGGRVHDLLHAVAAEKAGADELWTLDQNDFKGLTKVALKDPSGEPSG